MGLFGGKSSTSKAQGTSNAVVNSSGWVVGVGDAEGGNATSVSPSAAVSGDDNFLGVPPIGWASIGAVLLAMIYFKKRKKA